MAALKPPAKICLQVETNPYYVIMVSKSAGPPVVLGNGTFKFSNITGELVVVGGGGTILGMPINGAGHTKGNFFHFRVAGSGYLPTVYDTVMLELESIFNLLTNKGWWRLLIVHRDISGSEVLQSTAVGDNLHQVDCSTVEIAY